MTDAAIISRALSLAAAPTFAAMALMTAMRHGAPDMLCSAEGASPLAGMLPMYLMMSAFHVPPWLTLLSRRRAHHVASWKMIPRVKRSPLRMRLTPWRSATR